jgi:hypothetical protein
VRVYDIGVYVYGMYVMVCMYTYVYTWYYTMYVATMSMYIPTCILLCVYTTLSYATTRSMELKDTTARPYRVTISVSYTIVAHSKEEAHSILDPVYSRVKDIVYSDIPKIDTPYTYSIHTPTVSSVRIA